MASGNAVCFLAAGWFVDIVFRVVEREEDLRLEYGQTRTYLCTLRERALLARRSVE